MSKKVVVQGICYDEKSSFMRGPAQAPQLIRERLWSDAYNAYSELGVAVTRDSVIDMGDAEISAYEEIYKITKHNLASSDLLLTWGGDHSVSYPVLKAFTEVHKGKRLDLLHIDAHADLYDSFEGDKNSHACPFARIMEDGLVNRLVQVGIRTLTPHQREQADRYNVEIIQMKDFNLSSLPVFQNPLYISLDIDGFDPAFAPGVSHQESGGLTPREVIALLHSINTPLLGADVVEYNPVNDVVGITAALASKMSKELLAMMIS